MSKKEIIKMTNKLIDALLYYGEEELAEDVTYAISMLEPIEEKKEEFDNFWLDDDEDDEEGECYD